VKEIYPAHGKWEALKEVMRSDRVASRAGRKGGAWDGTE
jgi:hypothetical protein